MNLLKMFVYKFQNKGEIEMDMISIIPVLLYLSKSFVFNKESGKTGGVIYALHLTPWFAIGFTGRRDKP